MTEMLPRKNAYDQAMLQRLGLEELQAEELTGHLEGYLTQYHSCFENIVNAVEKESVLLFNRRTDGPPARKARVRFL